VRGLRPLWVIATSVLAIVGGSVLTAIASDPLWIPVAFLAVLLLGAFSAWDAAERRAAIAEPKAARSDLLEKRCDELAKAYAVSQAQYKVLGDFSREHRLG
jgi:hypothetical protein